LEDGGEVLKLELHEQLTVAVGEQVADLDAIHLREADAQQDQEGQQKEHEQPQVGHADDGGAAPGEQLLEPREARQSGGGHG